MKNVLFVCLSLLVLASSGCASFKPRVPKSAMLRKEQPNVVYMSIRTSIPKDALQNLYTVAAQKAAVDAKAIDPAIIGAIAGAIPEVTPSEYALPRSPWEITTQFLSRAAVVVSVVIFSDGT